MLSDGSTTTLSNLGKRTEVMSVSAATGTVFIENVTNVVSTWRKYEDLVFWCRATSAEDVSGEMQAEACVVVTLEHGANVAMRNDATSEDTAAMRSLRTAIVSESYDEASLMQKRPDERPTTHVALADIFAFARRVAPHAESSFSAAGPNARILDVSATPFVLGRRSTRGAFLVRSVALESLPPSIAEEASTNDGMVRTVTFKGDTGLQTLLAPAALQRVRELNMTESGRVPGRTQCQKHPEAFHLVGNNLVEDTADCITTSATLRVVSESLGAGVSSEAYRVESLPRKDLDAVPLEGGDPMVNLGALQAKQGTSLDQWLANPCEAV